MSDIKMCDNCGDIFSVNDLGWRASNEQWNGDPQTHALFNNVHNHGAITRHMGPCCSGATGTVRPRVTLAELPSGRIVSTGDLG